MPTTRELRDRIASIDNTLKITNAMYLISSTKLRKARADLQKTEPYFYTLQTTIQRVLRHLPEEFTHPYLDVRQHLRDEAMSRPRLSLLQQIRVLPAPTIIMY